MLLKNISSYYYFVVDNNLKLFNQWKRIYIYTLLVAHLSEYILVRQTSSVTKHPPPPPPTVVYFLLFFTLAVVHLLYILEEKDTHRHFFCTAVHTYFLPVQLLVFLLSA